ncbi:MAG TPA: isoleucine--tRNA ligase [Bryobacteraceae bacterium]|nr:isoleucine--tRNA ligase [Bryobacteraceae bacterium]
MESPDLKSDLKKTIHLPRTDFPMKASLAQLEPKLLARWGQSGIYRQIRTTRKGRPTYILHDGPPYANGNIHLGHAFNKLLKDFIVKVKTMEGYDSPYVPGWDCHGLPIEIKVDGQLGSKKAGMSAAQVRAACRKYAEKYVDLQRKDFIRLGVFGRWDDPYLTMSAEYEAVIAGAFVEFLDQGYVYKGLKPVHWCIHDRTALAEAEVEYENHSSPSIWVKFALTSDPEAIDPALKGKKVWGLIWTTTPWTIPANLGICFHPKFMYAAAEVQGEDGGEVYIVAVDLLQATGEACGWAEPKVLAAFEGSKLDGALFRHPFLDRTSLGILGDHVTLEQGTGAVHTAPGHGQEDYQIGLANGLSVYCPVDGAGRFYHASGAEGRLPEELIGKTVWAGNPLVIEILKRAGALASERKIEHSYPHCWRCHNPTIFRATEQWFINLEHNHFRRRALEAVQKVKWNPSWGEERIGNMIATRPDWCISRQRAWGVPILVFYCEACHEPFTDRKVLDRVVELIRKHTADVWYSKSAAELIGEEGVCKKCGGTSFRKENDILDVWFDSGASHLAVLTPQNDLPWPSDMYLEGGDQYRGWFHSSLLVAVGLRGTAPYRASATSGWVLDGEGHALSKSKGAEEVEKIMNKYGAELLRLWTASVDFTEDVRFSDTIVSRLIEAYRKLRNTFRYALGNLADFDPAADAVPAAEMLEIDRWILARAENLVRSCRAWYNEMAFHKVYRAIYDFATTDLSAVYFDVLKDRLYTAATKSRARRSGQTALYKVHYALTRLAAPLLSFTTEEVWSYTKKPAGAPESVHLALLPDPEELTSGLDAAKIETWWRLMEIREVVLKALEEARQNKLIGTSLEAKVRLAGFPLPEYAADLPALFIVSQVILEPGAELQVTVERADGAKCERCWKYSTAVGDDPKYPTVCDWCSAALKEMEAPGEMLE